MDYAAIQSGKDLIPTGGKYQPKKSNSGKGEKAKSNENSLPQSPTKDPKKHHAFEEVKHHPVWDKLDFGSETRKHRIGVEGKLSALVGNNHPIDITFYTGMVSNMFFQCYVISHYLLRIYKEIRIQDLAQYTEVDRQKDYV